MATGRVLQFDAGRGYGFVAADDGGEDVFLHASVFDGDPGELVPGTPVEFQVMAGDRGRKAFAAHFADAGISTPAKMMLAQPIPMPAKMVSAQPIPMPAKMVSAQPIPTPAAMTPTQPVGTPEDEQMCDVLSPTEFVAELTELLIGTVPTLTGQQIREVRQGVVESARKHGWVDA
jgi:cold shock protein